MHENIIKIRLQFSKTDTLRFIGHLDFLRVFQQTIRRAALPVAYSQGFNPHILLSFALPLPLGMESINDYADLTLEKEMPLDEIAAKMNMNAPVGLKISKASPVENGRAAAITVAADYLFHANIPTDIIAKALASETIVVPKKTKSGIKDTDIRPDILDIWQQDGKTILRLSAGSARFLNPLTVAEFLTSEKPSASNLSRLELYQSDESGGFTPL